MAQKVRVGLIGAGYWGPNLARNFDEMADAELVAVADMREDRLERLASRFPHIKTVQTHKDLMEHDLDAVVIATPPVTHHKLAKDCLENGLHVLIEKPITLDSESAEDLIAVAEENDRVLMVGHTFEYNPAVRKIKELIDLGELGDIYYIDAARTNLGIFQPNVNALWDLAPHDISIVLYLLGELPTTVSSYGGSFVLNKYGVHDLVYTHMGFANGTISNILVSWLDPNKTRKVTVVGSKKMLVYDDVGLEKIKIFDKGVEVHPDTDNYGNFQCQYRYGDAILPHIDWQEPLRVECQHFIDCIRDGKQPQSDGRSGLNVVKILEMADWSLKHGSEPVQMSWEPSDRVPTGM